MIKKVGRGESSYPASDAEHTALRFSGKMMGERGGGGSAYAWSDCSELLEEVNYCF